MDSLYKEINIIYQCYYKDVYRFCYELCNQDAHLAEELTQNTFYKAILAADSFKGNCEIKTWLCRIARNDYLNYLRKEKRLSKTQASEQLLEDIPDIRPSVLQQIEDSESTMEILRVLDALEPPYAEVFRLKIINDMEYKEIAELYGKTENWVRVTYYRAKQKIIEALKQKG
ncbi:MAG: sigma-70 family RNA polymerase sigma factor [Lachnospiraceae bacterium]|nr:sigma-70 family RNA polymerase sigma factor [Lachnospiraceae bacterium]